MKFYEKLQSLRKAEGFSQERLAERIGVSRQAVAMWESGLSYPDIDRLIELSCLFNVSIDRLVKEDEDCGLMGESQAGTVCEEGVVAFLCRAKRSTYAGKGAETAPSRSGSHDLAYSEGSLSYYDTYLGGEKFVGEEAIFRNDIAFWSMNYIGRIVGEGFSSDFLKEALLAVPEAYPYRGPLVYSSGDYIYHCTVTGNFEWFQGQEEIFCGEWKVYECIFHGGSVK